jgi:osmoprotectant transport system substrate-binding protein
VLVVTGACTSDDGDLAASGRPDGSAVIVTSFNFAESRLVAEIYAAALEGAGVPVRRELDLGPRELVAPALAQGLVDLVPEYLGTALVSAGVDGADRPASVAAAREALEQALAGAGVTVLEPAGAQNQNAVVVERETARRLGLVTISDLAPHAEELTLVGPPECPRRRYCLLGLDDTYGLGFRRFVALEGAARTARALEDDVADVAIMFATDGQLASDRYVILDDDRHLQPAENIVPIVRRAAVARHGTRVVSTLEDISRRLTTTALRLLNWRVAVAGRDPATEARGWLVRQGVLAR